MALCQTPLLELSNDREGKYLGEPYDSLAMPEKPTVLLVMKGDHIRSNFGYGEEESSLKYQGEQSDKSGRG